MGKSDGLGEQVTEGAEQGGVGHRERVDLPNGVLTTRLQELVGVEVDDEPADIEEQVVRTGDAHRQPDVLDDDRTVLDEQHPLHECRARQLHNLPGGLVGHRARLADLDLDADQVALVEEAGQPHLAAELPGRPVEEWQDEARTERLTEIIDEYGWPTRTLVGDDGATAAWLIAQHSDLDVDFQERALELMRAAVEDGEADPTELAYLEDRVALNSGRPQTYGTQIACVDGHAEPSELADPDRVEELREEVGLQPLDDYLAELEPACQEEASGGAGD